MILFTAIKMSLTLHVKGIDAFFYKTFVSFRNIRKDFNEHSR